MGRCKTPVCRQLLDSGRDPVEAVAACLHLEGSLPAMMEALAECERDGTPPRESFVRVASAGVAAREDRRTAMRMRLARFPSSPMTVETFDFSWIPAAEKENFAKLLENNCRWISEGRNVLFEGAPGTGKTHLAVALGKRAVAQGYSVRFLAANEFFRRAFSFKDDLDGYDAWMNGLLKNHALILDDICSPLVTGPDRSVFLHDIVARAQSAGRSLILTTNVRMSDWPRSIMGGSGRDGLSAGTVAAASDRIVGNCEMILLETKRSYRMQLFCDAEDRRHRRETGQEASGPSGNGGKSPSGD